MRSNDDLTSTIASAVVPIVMQEVKDQILKLIDARLNQQLVEQSVEAEQRNLLDRRQMAQRLGISVTTLDRKRKLDEIPVVQIGARVLFDEEQVVAAIQGSATNDSSRS